VIGRSVLLTQKDVLDAEDLRLDEPGGMNDLSVRLPDPFEGFQLDDFLDGARRQLFTRALEMSAGNQSAAARLLGVSPQAVHKFVHGGTNRSG
jgi:DNA-binding NtrC family response regulator